MSDNVSHPIFSKLEVPCDECDGLGVLYGRSGGHQCEQCGGAGYVPTEFGEKILDLKRHNFRPMLEDAQGGR